MKQRSANKGHRSFSPLTGRSSFQRERNRKGHHPVLSFHPVFRFHPVFIQISYFLIAGQKVTLISLISGVGGQSKHCVFHLNVNYTNVLSLEPQVVQICNVHRAERLWQHIAIDHHTIGIDCTCTPFLPHNCTR